MFCHQKSGNLILKKNTRLKVEGHLNSRLFNPKLQPWTFQPQIFQPWTFQHKTFQPWFMVEKSGVERSGVEAWGWKIRDWNVLQPTKLTSNKCNPSWTIRSWVGFFQNFIVLSFLEYKNNKWYSISKIQPWFSCSIFCAVHKYCSIAFSSALFLFNSQGYIYLLGLLLSYLFLTNITFTLD